MAGHISAAKKSFWPCMCGYLLPLGTPRDAEAPPPPSKSAEIQAAGPGPSSDSALAPRQTSSPVFTASFAQATQRRHSPLSLFLLARYQPCQVYMRYFNPPGPGSETIKVSRVRLSTAVPFASSIPRLRFLREIERRTVAGCMQPKCTG